MPEFNPRYHVRVTKPCRTCRGTIRYITGGGHCVACAIKNVQRDRIRKLLGDKSWNFPS